LQSLQEETGGKKGGEKRGEEKQASKKERSRLKSYDFFVIWEGGLTVNFTTLPGNGKITMTNI
jgi:hypothetical protein